MPRKARMYVEGVPCHVIQRGNNRQACFFAEEDYLFYLDCLQDACTRHKVALHAYVLMTNHVHFLMTPENITGISLVMQSVGRRYVQYINKTYRRSGTLWEGRYKANPVAAAEYLLACHRYIEMNPVAASMVEQPGLYRWSSYLANAGYKQDPLLSPHAIYIGLDEIASKRTQCYRELFAMHLSKELVNQIKVAALFSVPLGSAKFKEEIESMLAIKAGNARRGRPVRTLLN